MGGGVVGYGGWGEGYVERSLAVGALGKAQEEVLCKMEDRRALRTYAEARGNTDRAE